MYRARGMVDVIRHGRIYRLVPDGRQPGPRPRMLDQSGAELVAYLDHPNGWWRDNAQKLIVCRGDTSVAPALQDMARYGQTENARINAMWTLEGLGLISKDIVLANLGHWEEASQALPEIGTLPNRMVDDPLAQHAAIHARLIARTEPERAAERALWALRRPVPLLAIRGARIATDAARALAQIDEQDQAREIARLKRLLAEKDEELAILGKAAAYFAKGVK